MYKYVYVAYDKTQIVIDICTAINHFCLETLVLFCL